MCPLGLLNEVERVLPGQHLALAKHVHLFRIQLIREAECGHQHTAQMQYLYAALYLKVGELKGRKRA